MAFMSIAGKFENVRDVDPDLAMDAIAERLRLAREYAGLTQEQFAEQIGFSRRQVIAWEKRQNSPPILVFAKLRSVCGVDPEWVLSGPGLVPLVEVTEEDRARDTRVSKRLRQIASSYGLNLSTSSVEDLARIVLREPAEMEEAAIERMTETVKILARG